MSESDQRAPHDPDSHCLGRIESSWRRPALVPLSLVIAALTIAGYGYTIGDFFLADDFVILDRTAGAQTILEACTAGGSTWG